MIEVKVRHVFFIFLLLIPLLANASSASSFIEVRLRQVNLDWLDTLRIVYTSTKNVTTVKQSPPDGFMLYTTESRNSTWFQGTIDLSPENATEGLYQYSPAFTSSAEYTLTILVMRYNETISYIREMGGTVTQLVKILRSYIEPVTEYFCEANSTVQVNLTIGILGSGSQSTTQTSIFSTLPNIPDWEVGLYALTITPFLGTAILNIRDLRRVRRAVWTARNSAAVLVRSLFFGLILGFILAGIVFLALAIARVFGAPMGQGLPSIPTVLVSTLPIIPIGIAYWLARRSGWYDILDEVA